MVEIMGNLPRVDEFELYDSERKLLECAERGLMFNRKGRQYGTGVNRPVLRGTVIEALGTGRIFGKRDEPWPVHYTGIHIHHAIIECEDDEFGNPILNFGGADIHRILWFEHVDFVRSGSAITGDTETDRNNLALVMMREAAGSTVGMQNCRLRRLIAPKLELTHNLYLDDSEFPNGIALNYAVINGRLSCRNVVVGRNSPYLNGEEVLPDADPEDYEKAKPLRPDDDADLCSLNCRNARIGGSVYLTTQREDRFDPQKLDKTFDATGKVELRRAQISGRLDLRKAKIKSDDFHVDDHSRRIALRGDGLSVVSSVMLGGGFKADGEVNFVGARIGSDFNCAGGLFNCERRQRKEGEKDFSAALNLGEAVIGAGLYLTRNSEFQPERDEDTDSKYRTKINGRLILSNATCQIYCDALSKNDTFDELAIPKKHRIALDGFRYELFGDCPVKWRIRYEWLKRQDEEDLTRGFRQQPWAQLIHVLRSMGHSRQATEIAMKRERAYRRSKEPGPLERLKSRFLGLTVGHGYRPMLPLVWAFFVFFIPSLFLFTLAAEKGWMAPRSVDILVSRDWNEKNQLPPGYRSLDPAYYAGDVIIPIVDPQQTVDWAPYTKALHCKFPSPLRSWLEARGLSSLTEPYDVAADWAYDRFLNRMFQGGFLDFWQFVTLIAGWVLIPLFIAGASGVMRQEGGSP